MPAFVADWHAGDYAGMYALISPPAKARVSFSRFVSLYKQAAAIATVRGLRAIGRPRREGAAVTVPMSVATRLFGRVAETMSVPVVGKGHRRRVGWTRALTFPGLEAGERLAVHARAPQGRGRILDRSGAVLAQGPATARTYPQGSAFAIVTGDVKPPAAAAVPGRERAGWPATAPYGQSGLEESLDSLLAGTPRFVLRAISKATGLGRVLAVQPGTNPQNVTTTLRVPIQQAAATALGARYGGVVVLSARTGAVEADVGLGMDALQPPGSSFKTITSAAALTAGKTTLTTVYPYARFALLNGWKLHNFHHEDCGGSLVLAFAVSCNSVFGPLAVTVGAPKPGRDGERVRVQPPRVDRLSGARERDPARGGDDGATRHRRGRHRPGRRRCHSAADGLGGADDRLRVHPQAAVSDPAAARVPRAARTGDACSRKVAGELTTMMEAVVSEGTGRSAAIPGVTVAGKTGTSEVGPANVPTDAWFIAFAPVGAPKVAVAVLVVKGGVGGDVAAPIARQVLEAALAQ